MEVAGPRGPVTVGNEHMASSVGPACFRPRQEVASNSAARRGAASIEVAGWSPGLPTTVHEGRGRPVPRG